MSLPLPVPPRLLVQLHADERPVELVELHVAAEVSGALAVTTWELVFHNPNLRTLEGQLEFPLLAGQAIVRFAMDVDGALREAVPVAKQKGRQVFEEVVRREVDPGLLERSAGDSYRARVYPLLPGQRKRVVIAYQEALIDRDGTPRYRLALDFPKLRRFTLRLAVRGASEPPTVVSDGLGLRPRWRGAVAEVEREDLVASGLLELALASRERPAVTTQRLADATYFRVERELAPRTRPRLTPRTLGIVWDASGSGHGRDVQRELALIDHYLRAVPGAVTVLLVRLRDTAEPAERFEVRGGDSTALRAAISATEFDGASALTAWRPDPEVDAWLLCSDGLFNYSAGADEQRPDTGLAPVHAVVSTARADSARLRGLCDRSGGELLDLLAEDVATAAARLSVETERLLAIDRSPHELTDIYPEIPAPLTGPRLVLAGRLHVPQATLVAYLGFPDDPAGVRSVELSLAGDDGPGELAARAWATMKIAALEPEHRANKEELARTGRDFGIVTRDTSLIILESAADYAQYDITPPPELHAAWSALQDEARRDAEQARESRLARLTRMFDEYLAWWERDYSPAPAPAPAKKRAAPVAAGGPPPPAPPPPMAACPPAAPVSASFDASAPLAEPVMREEASASAAAEDGAPTEIGVSIALQPWTPDAPYLDRLRAAADHELLATYLAARRDHARSTAFFLDVADLFFERGHPAIALRVLSNLAELDLDNHAVLRILGYRLLQADRPDLARPIFAQVLGMRPDEPQSHRDLAQACAALGDTQAAVDLLWQVATGEWDHRFPEIELMALVELGALIARSEAPLALDHIDPRLRRHTPLDLRVVLTWDADNTDIDLWVTDPDGEKAYYGNRLSARGGRVSADFREGYGPEDYSLRRAAPGEYLVEANYYGNRQQIIAGATTIQLQFITRFATAQQREQRVTLRLREQREVVTVGRFTIA